MLVAHCVCNEGFEDALTSGSDYRIQAVAPGENSYLLVGDNGISRWYGRLRFTMKFIKGA
jgi:hypothetical protein